MPYLQTRASTLAVAAAGTAAGLLFGYTYNCKHKNAIKTQPLRVIMHGPPVSKRILSIL